LNPPTGREIVFVSHPFRIVHTTEEGERETKGKEAGN
jgi:hypothetical protein